MKKIFVIIGIVLCLIILAVVGCAVNETEIEIIKTENNKMFVVVIEQKGISNIEHQICIYSGLKRTRFHYNTDINDFNMCYDGTFDSNEYYKINLMNDLGYTTTYLYIRSEDINKTFEKVMLLNEFDDYDYSIIKEYVLEKIIGGEFEWLYSYGDALLSEGQDEILKILKNLNDTEQCSNDFIEEDLIFKKCQELLQKYGGEH